MIKKRPKIHLRSPKKNDLVIYDVVASSSFKSLVDVYKPYYLDIRGNSYHLLPSVYSMFCFFFARNRRRLLDIYIESLLKIIKPKLIGTNLDIDARFWVIKAVYPTSTTFFVQHGIIDNSIVNHNYLLETHREVDWMFTFNSYVASHLTSSLKLIGNTIPIGSLKSNHVPIAKLNKKFSRTLFIVSEWEPRLSTVEAKNFLFIFRCISKFCSSNDLEISILPRYANKDLEFRFEKEFYDSIPNFKFNIAFKDSDLSNYSTADNGFGVVFFFSTLGYEIGARNQVPVVSISFRAKVEKNSYRTFGWPADLKLPIKGVCDEISEESILGTLETLHSGGIGIEIFKRLCVMDQGNDIFRKFLARYLD